MKINAISFLQSNIYRLLFLVFVFLFSNVGTTQFAKAQEDDFAKYTNLKPNVFLKNWYVIGPIGYSDKGETPNAEVQKTVFKKDELTSVKNTENGFADANIQGKVYSWKKIKSKEDIVDFLSELVDSSWVYAYALANIEVDANEKMLFGIGSDDAVKIFLNGKEVHSKFVGRGVRKDNDLLELELIKGTNQILIKVQNFQGGWGFSFRPIGEDVLAELLYSSASHGDMDNLEILMKYNPNLEWKSAEGLTAWQQANVNGRADVAELLEQNGALVENKFPAVKDYIDLYIKNVIKEETPGFAVLVAEDGDIIFKKGYGYADIKEKIPVTSDTKFRIGSITKQFVASGILKLQEQGKLSVDDKLSKYMPDFPRGDEVTIHHLLTHTSGIHSFTNRPEFVDYVTKKIEAKTLVDSIKSWDFDFDPGEELIYNNSGYFLLGEIIEKVTGKWYGDYLQEVFFKPLGMSNTGIYVNEQPPKNMALGYTVKNEKYTPALDWNMSWAGGAGSMYSTVGDLFKWNEALYDGKVLSEESLEAAHTPVKLNNGELPAFGKYGYGWMISDFRGTTEIAHGGGLHGFISYLSRIKEEDLTIVALTNSTPTMDGLNPNTTSAVFAQYVLWEKLDNKKSNKTVEIDKNKLNDFVGRYDYGNSMVLTVTQADDKLFAQMSGQNQFELFPSAEDEFYWKVVEAKIQFKRDGTGKVVHGIHFQGGRELKVLKLPELVSLEIDADKIKPFVGNYKFNDDFMIEVTFTDGHLFVQGTGQPKFELFRVEADKYMPKEIMLAIRFIEEEGSYKIEMDQGSTKTIIEKVE